MQAELNWNSVCGRLLGYVLNVSGKETFSICTDHSKQLRDLIELLTRRKIPSELYDKGLSLLSNFPACGLSP